MTLDSSIETTLSEISKVMSANSIIGHAISTKDKTIIPISKMAVGFGVGTASNTGSNETKIGGAGGGGSIDPIAFVIIYNDISGPEGVEILPVSAETPLENLLSTAGKTIFDFISGSISPDEKSSSGVSSNIDNIKTKIKPQKE
ncbi:MAG: hypothetical protein BZ136_02785 [Methanosphaera sp. rholeuAM74]|nr:MAG: hypothetical protein BZ136_02785 [Methanosphaera sp. rholeuAM74]